MPDADGPDADIQDEVINQVLTRPLRLHARRYIIGHIEAVVRPMPGGHRSDLGQQQLGEKEQESTVHKPVISGIQVGGWKYKILL